MIYQTGAMQLEILGELRQNSFNSVQVCSNPYQPGNPRYLVWCVRHHEKAKQILEQLYGQEESCCIQCFTDGTDTFFLFPYREPRPLRRFYSPRYAGQKEKYNVYSSLILSLISSKLPYSLLYLIIMQDQINISLSGEIYFTLDLDLSQWKEKRQERDCVQACVEKLLFYLEQGESRWEKELCRLLKKKAGRSAYGNFTELYRDFTLMEKEESRSGRRVWKLSPKIWNRLFTVLRVVCGVLAGAAVVVFASQLFWGEVPILRLLEPSFEKIGTESLLQ